MNFFYVTVLFRNVLQLFQGDITLVPRVSILDYIKLISDPGHEGLKRYKEHGIQITWKKVVH